LDNLPTGPVEERNLLAAFQDPQATATPHLLDKMQPRRVRVSRQLGRTRDDAGALSILLDTYAASTGAQVPQLREPSSPGTGDVRYRHGKLIEWVTSEGKRLALTGSPNLSSAALPKHAGQGGNYELALLSPVNESLFPGGE